MAFLLILLLVKYFFGFWEFKRDNTDSKKIVQFYILADNLVFGDKIVKYPFKNPCNGNKAVGVDC